MSSTQSMFVAMMITCTLTCEPTASAQTLAGLQGRVYDTSGAILADATVTIRDSSTGFEAVTRTEADGRYHFAAVTSGSYRVLAGAPGFRTEVIERLDMNVARTVVRDFRLDVSGTSEIVTVHAEIPSVDRATTTVGHVVPEDAVRQLPLNGRHFADLGMLVPGAVAPSQTGFSTTPIRGVGALAINVAGSREESVGFILNGVSTNNLTFGSLIFEPPLASIQEFKVDNTGYSAEFGHVSGAVVNIVTRAGADAFNGELFEFLRNDAFDARNYFEFTTSDPHAFARNQFGASLGGPLRHGRTFFFAAYEGLRQHQGVDLNSLVLSDEQRAAITDPVVRQIIGFVPRANFAAADGTPRFIGSASAIANMDRWTVDLRHNMGDNDRLQAFYGSQEVFAVEPLSQGTTVPGFGNRSRPARSALTLGETHIFGSGMLNELRAGRVRLEGGTYPATILNPQQFGIDNGITRAIGLPQFNVAGGLTFGGPGSLPMGRFDTSYVVTDTITRIKSAHALRFGGEYRHFINENFAEGTGTFNFPSVESFMNGVANAFNITLGERQSLIDQRALGLFVQDRIAVNSRLSLDLGVRYEWHVTPTERHDRFVVFDAADASLARVVGGRDAIYRQNNRNVEPRLGAVWDTTGDGRTVVRGALASTVDEPVTTAVRDTAANPPFAAPLTAAGAIPLSSAIDIARPGGLAPATVDPNFRNASLQSWNVNLQRQVMSDIAITVGYMTTRGRQLRISRNINQPVNGVRPFPAVSPSSTIMPGVPLGNITQVESSGFSRYRGAWTSLTKRLANNLQLDGSYTWSKSLDTNSLNSSGFAVQNAYDIPGQYGLSDFDTRHRFVLNAIYTGPTGGHVVTRGWQLAAIVQAQSGNPVNIVTSTSSLTGVANSVRPDLTGPIRIIGSVDQWFDRSAFSAVNRFGNLRRNAVTGPAFHNTDLSVIRQEQLAGGTRLELRVDIFDLFNRPNFGPPGNIVGSPMFGQITRTRLPTGEAGSSRQIQLAAKLLF